MKGNKQKEEEKQQKSDFVVEPTANKFKLKAVLKTNYNDIIKKLSKVPDVEAVKTKEGIAIIKVDHRDINGYPYLFQIIYLNKDNIEILFSITPEVSKRKRQLDIIRYISNIISVFEGAYEIDITEFMQTFDLFLDEINDFATSDYQSLFTKYDAALTRIDELKEKNEKNEIRNEILSRELMEVKDKYDQVKLKLTELEKYSDETLTQKILEWIREHYNEIDVTSFCKIHKVSETRVEQILNKMVREGYLEVRK
jgi:hypothetical protein